MFHNGEASVKAALEMLLEEVERAIEGMKRKASMAIDKEDSKHVKKCLNWIDEVKSFRVKVITLNKEWDKFEASKREKYHPGTVIIRIPRGQRTPMEDFYLPILNALVQIGGSGEAKEILARVEQLMKGTLNDIDYQSLPSNPQVLRWHNTANWARFKMVGRGLLQKNSPRGIWEITEAGRRFLK